MLLHVTRVVRSGCADLAHRVLVYCYRHAPPFQFHGYPGLLSGPLGVGGLAFGCTMMVQETRLAIQNLAEEAEIAALTVQTPVMATNR